MLRVVEFSRTSTRTTTRTLIVSDLIVLVLVLVLVLGCFPIAHYYTHGGCLRADAKFSIKLPLPETSSQEPELWTRKPKTLTNHMKGKRYGKDKGSTG